MILLVKLILAHIAGDFLLQPDKWVLEKETSKHRSAKLYIHAALHGILAWLLVWDITFWLPALTITITHYAIDLLKVNLQKPTTRTQWFVADQVLHLVVIALLWCFWIQPDLEWILPPPGHFWLVLTAAILLTSPTSVAIKTVISQWTPDTYYDVSSSLPDAGKFIGFLERLLILLFVLLDHWEAVGFLLAAKSVFRFGNLKESHDRKLTEYVLIGTLLSFGIALLVSLLVSWLMRQAVIH